MSEFRIFETDEFRKRLAGLPARDARLIGNKLSSYVYPQPRDEPFFGPNIKKLPDQSPAVWRYRIGRFRIFYAVDESERTVFVLTVDLRRDAYRR